MLTNIDFQILDWIQAHFQCSALDRFMPMITRLGDAGIFWILLTIVLLCIPRTRRLGLASLIALLLDVLLVNVTLKQLFLRPRPFTLREYPLLITPPTDTSFPSGHTAASFASAFSILFSRHRLSGKLGFPGILLAAVIAFSRLYLRVHYPSDVLGGILCGLLCGVIGGLLAVRIGKKSCKLSDS